MSSKNSRWLLDRLVYGYYWKWHYEWLLSYSNFVFKLKTRSKDIGVGQDYAIWGPVDMMKYPGSHIEIGERFHCISDAVRSSASTVRVARIETLSSHARISIGNDVGLNGTYLSCKYSSIKIGDHAMVGPDCVITDSGFWFPGREGAVGCSAMKGDIEIGKNVWIGMRCLILNGARVGDNSVVGAGSTVTNVVEPDSVYAGNPARLIRRMSAQDQRHEIRDGSSD